MLPCLPGLKRPLRHAGGRPPRACRAMPAPLLLGIPYGLEEKLSSPLRDGACQPVVYTSCREAERRPEGVAPRRAALSA